MSRRGGTEEAEQEGPLPNRRGWCGGRTAILSVKNGWQQAARGGGPRDWRGDVWRSTGRREDSRDSGRGDRDPTPLRRNCERCRWLRTGAGRHLECVVEVSPGNASAVIKGDWAGGSWLSAPVGTLSGGG